MAETNQEARPGPLAWLEYGALRAMVAVLRTLPLETAVRLSGAVWAVVAPLTSRQRRAQEQLAALMPELTEVQRRAVLRGMWRNLGQTFAESLLLDRIAAEPERLTLDPACRAIAQRTKDDGAVIAVPHLGNWEVAVLPLAALGGWHAAVYRAAKNALSETYLLGIRRRFYTGGLAPKGKSAAQALMRHARAGGSVGLMADLRDGSGVDVPFFGRPAPSTPMPALLARQFHRPLFAVCMVREGAARFRMVAQEVPVTRSADRAADVLATTAALQAVFEHWVRQWPEQWMWAHRRFRGSPAP